MKPTVTYSEFVTEDGADLEVKGEVFDRPIKQIKETGVDFYTRVQISNVETKEPINNIFFKKENDEDTLKILVNAIKNDPKYLKKGL